MFCPFFIPKPRQFETANVNAKTIRLAQKLIRTSGISCAHIIRTVIFSA
jgi:hypothetical protein